MSACLAVLVGLEQGGSAYVSDGSADADHGSHPGSGDVAPAPWGSLTLEVKFYYLANTCMYGAAILSDDEAEKNFDWLLTRFVVFGWDRAFRSVVRSGCHARIRILWGGGWGVSLGLSRGGICIIIESKKRVQCWMRSVDSCFLRGSSL